MAFEDDARLQTAIEAKRRNADRLLALPGVHGVGVGYKEVAGKATDQLAVVVLVDCKLPRAKLSADQVVDPVLAAPSLTELGEAEVPTDVRERARALPCAHVNTADLAMKHRPAPAGVWIAVATGGGSGTLGGWFWDDRDDEIVFLSNRHVLGDVVGALIAQPVFSMTGADHSFGRVRRASNAFDATIGAPFSSSDADFQVFGGGPAVFETGTASLSMAVEKTGARTGHTEGTVDLLNFSTKSPCHRTSTAFSIAPTGRPDFSQTGDSGSVILERTNPSGAGWKRGVGLLFCQTTDGSFGYAHQLQEVMADLSLVTVCEVIARIIDGILEGGIRIGSSAMASSMARETERKMMASAEGKRMVEIVHDHRHDIVQVLANPDGRRAFEAAFGSLLDGVVTTDDLFSRSVGDTEVAELSRLVEVALSVAPALDAVAPEARRFIESAAAATIGLSVGLGNRPEAQAD